MGEHPSAYDLLPKIRANEVCAGCGKHTRHYVRMLRRWVCDDCSPVDRETGELKGACG